MTQKLPFTCGQRVVFIGDSITDCGRREPQHRPYGCGYVSIFRNLMIARQPDLDVDLVNQGVGGNTVDDLRSRWHDDVLLLRPDWLSIKIGINDANRHLNGNDNGGTLAPEPFTETLDMLLRVTREQLPACRLFLISPFFLSLDDGIEGSYRVRLNEILLKYIAGICDLAEKYDAPFVDLHAMFRRYLKHLLMRDLAPEPVHPNATGHTIMAEEIYRAFVAAGF